MPGIAGIQTALAWGKLVANSWGVPTSVTYGIYTTGDGGMQIKPTYVEDESSGQSFLGPAEVGDFGALDVTWETQKYYDHSHYRLEALAMGSPAAVTVVSSQAASSLVAYSHVLDPAPNTDGLAVTLACDKVQYVEELTSAKVTGFSFTVGNGGVINETFTFKGTKTTNISSVNIRSTILASITFPALTNRVFRKQGVFRINAQAGGALGASDAMEYEQIAVAMARPVDAINVGGQDYIVEPAITGYPTFDVSVTFPRMNTVAANSLYGKIRDNSQSKADLTFTGPFINSTSARSELYQFPYLEIQSFETPVVGGDQVKPKATFKAKKPSAAPTGMSGVTVPMRETRVTVNSLIAF